jgi:hypothetical protein
MTWLNRGFKVRHKFIKERNMKAEAIRALELFKQQHLAREVQTEQADMVSESSQPTEENQVDTFTTESKQKSFNYPDHIKPLSERMLSALNNGARTVDTVAKYCKEGEKLVRLQLNLMVSRGKIGKQTTPASGITRYYPADIASQMGILTAPQPINRKPKKLKTEKRSSLPTHKPQPTQAEAFVLRGETVGITDKSQAKEAKYIEFLEKRITEWQAEARKMAKQISDLEAEVIKAKTEPRNVTGEVQEVMKEVMELRGTVAYLESKLFGRK